MKRTFNFGKVDYLKHGRKDCAVTVTVELREKEKGEELSICGDIWNARHTDIYCGGQCLDTIARYVKAPVFKELFRFWELYHLNDMHPECEHQAAAGWRDVARRYVPLYEFTLTQEARTAQRDLERRIMQAAKAGESWSTSLEEQQLLSLEYSMKYHAEALPEALAPFYKLSKTESKALGWLRENEHPEGILCKPCPVCGYKYGSAWNFFRIPENDLARIKELIEKGA